MKSAPPAMAAVDPSPLIQLSTAYWGSQTLLTANRLGLFAILAEGPRSADAIADRLGTRPRATLLLLRACVGLGLAEEKPEGFTASPLSATFLVPSSPAYLGDALRYSDNLYGPWGRLEDTLRTDAPALAPETYLGTDAGQTRDFVRGMHSRALAIGRALVDLVDLTGRRRLLDVGGGPGTYSALFLKRHDGLTARLIELPAVAAMAREIVDEMGVGDRIEVIAGDYHATAFPAGQDGVLASGIFHRETADACRNLIARAHGCLEGGGLLAVSDVFTEGGGTSPAFATLFGLNMALTAVNGGVHADQEVAGWMKGAGFRDVIIRPFPPPMPHRVILGIKA